MRKEIIALVILGPALLSLSGSAAPTLNLLDEGDFEFMERDRSNGPALSAPLGGEPYWASYNEWLCFPLRSVDISCLGTDYADGRKVPALHVTEGSHLFEFSLDPDPAPDCDRISERWKALLEGEEDFCVFASRLQELDTRAYDTAASTGSVWIVNRLKTSQGYWNFESRENWLQQDDLDESSAPPEPGSNDDTE